VRQDGAIPVADAAPHALRDALRHRHGDYEHAHHEHRESDHEHALHAHDDRSHDGHRHEHPHGDHA